jgi:hypothetical protein
MRLTGSRYGLQPSSLANTVQLTYPDLCINHMKSAVKYALRY